MDRRLVLKYIGVASAAAIVFPSCVGDAKKLSLALNNLKITADEEDLLAQIASSLVPVTDTPGAREVGAHLFAFVMVDDCFSQADQNKFLSGMRTFEKEIETRSNKSFTKASPDEKIQLLNKAEEMKDGLSEEVKAFYLMSKNLIIHGYLTSEHFLTNVKPYKHIPGPAFHGCKSLSNENNNVS